LDPGKHIRRIFRALRRPGDRVLTPGESDAERYWGHAFEQGGVTTWMSEEQCRRSINEMITGSADEWPMDWFQRVFSPDPKSIGLSLGCGDGALERDVRKKGVCREVTGIDLSSRALELAATTASDEGLDGIFYERADFNDLDLEPDRYDIVFFHQAMHHVANLEGCVQQIQKTLRKDGLFYLDEYVGPSRDRWTDALLERGNTVFQTLPKSVRRARKVPFPIEEEDPSEAIRSAEIVPLIEAGFEIVEKRDYGGNLLSVIHPLVRWNTMDEDTHRYYLDRIIEEERALLAEGTPSYYTVIIAKNR
jgi:SAM-dependent methyltransferase